MQKQSKAFQKELRKTLLTSTSVVTGVSEKDIRSMTHKIPERDLFLYLAKELFGQSVTDVAAHIGRKPPTGTIRIASWTELRKQKENRELENEVIAEFKSLLSNVLA